MLILLLFPLFSCARSPDEIVLARVEKEEIVVGDLKRAFGEHRDQYGDDLLSDPEGSFLIKKKLMNDLIEENLLLQIAREKNIALSREEDEAVSQQLKSGYSEGELERILQKKKITVDEWIGEQKMKKLVDKLLKQEIYSKASPGPKAIEDFYKKFRSEFRLPDRVRCLHIVSNKEDKAGTILALLKKGEPFASVAKKYSESPDRERGGDLGFIGRGDYPGVFEEACFSLPVGKTSDVIQSPYGFHIFHVVEKIPGRTLPLKEASPQIDARLREEIGRQNLRRWIDELHHTRKITLDEKALKEVSLLTP